jgi:DNA-binding response OmpR family regulator
MTDRIEITRIKTEAFLRMLELTVARGHSPTQAPLKHLLQSSPGRIFTRAEMIESMWGNDPDGGPDDPMRSIAQAIRKLRRAGFTVVSHYRGYSTPARREAA